ncbi:sigma-54-dependent Fis family transcriptional regulator [Denitromonas halophila]|uniref:Sigma-54-dependent Fis family transcriptional regulator n=1 Tax=Denitromonas halophila TaxID=1629404 RepID=A0A557QWB2_9RHOO|nr:sigma-54-dependent Fis family transcriptional regulator [Denitromonas halophila]TVO57197.1 sigma-54-dependent Fis family transcriptional regulator [Denitromonas halophila]
MHQIDQRAHIERVLSSTRSDAVHTDRIQQSWRRCIEDYDLDPTRPTPAHILEAGRLREHRDQIEDFLQVARTGMEQLYKRVCDLGYVLLLTDARGITVDFIGNDRWQGELRRSGLYLGADWSEARAGTCAVGTCIADRTAMTCHQTDHFDASHIGLTCNSAPLLDPTGDFLGVLDVSALTSPSPKESQHLALQLTMMYAKMIEDANFMHFFREASVLRLGAAWPMVDLSGELMLAFDADGVVVGANSGARRMLNGGGESGLVTELVGSSLDMIFREGAAEVWRIARAGVSNQRSALTTYQHGVFYADVIAPRALSGSRLATRDAEPEVSAPALDRLAGDDPQMQRLIRQAKRLVNKSVDILLHGETGTGKEVVAKALHESSERRDKAFVAINCAAIPESLIESELFGYAPGAFTGGRSKGMRGLIAQADGGTLFLDEIGDMPPHLQTRLLRVLAEKEITPLGGDKPQSIRLTVVAASHRDLRKLIAEGLFREDLYYRLCGAILYLPPLRERQDIAYLIDRLAAEEAVEMGDSASIEAPALAALCSHDWPGNVRQLRNVLRFALAVSDGGNIHLDDLPGELMRPLTDVREAPLPTRVATLTETHEAERPRWRDQEGQWLLESLQRHKWCITAVAEELGLCRATVYRRMKRYGIVQPNLQ